jgi:hypothetical protein
MSSRNAAKEREEIKADVIRFNSAYGTSRAYVLARLARDRVFSNEGNAVATGRAKRPGKTKVIMSL